MSIVDQLRLCATTERGPFAPHWDDSARLLMRWAADVIEAANKAIDAEIALR
jgi:hypothetical protein